MSKDLRRYQESRRNCNEIRQRPYPSGKTVLEQRRAEYKRYQDALAYRDQQLAIYEATDLVLLGLEANKDLPLEQQTMSPTELVKRGKKFRDIQQQFTDFTDIFAKIGRGDMTKENMDQQIRDIVSQSTVTIDQLISLGQRYQSSGERGIDQLKPYVQSLVLNKNFTQEQKDYLRNYDNKFTDNEYNLASWMIKFTTRDMNRHDRNRIFSKLRDKGKIRADHQKIYNRKS